MGVLSKFIIDGWELHGVETRYGDGIWFLISQNAGMLMNLSQLHNRDQIEATSLSEYYLNTGSWLPVALGYNLSEALKGLGSKLINITPAQMEHGSNWSVKVEEAYEAIVFHSESKYRLSSSLINDKLPANPLLV